MIGPDEKIRNRRYVELEWDDEPYDWCYECGSPLDEYEVHWGPDDHPYCEHHYYHIFERCEECGDDWARAQMTEIDRYRYICPNCREEQYTMCDVCSDIIHLEDAFPHKDMLVCEDCKEHKLERKKQ